MGLVLNTLAGDEKYLVLHNDNLTILTEMQLSEKQKTLSQFFAVFLKCISNFERFEKQDDPQRCCMFDITNSKNVVR